MFRLIRLLVGLVIFAGLGFVAVTVPLGEKTLWEHTKAIVSSKESRELVDGVKKKAAKVIDERGKDARGPTDKLTPKERDALRKLIRERLQKDESSAGGRKPPH